MLANEEITWNGLVAALHRADDKPVAAAEAICSYVASHLDNISHDELSLLFRSFFLLPIARPSALYTLLLEVVLQYAENHDKFNIVDFLQQWGLERNLRQDDREAVVSNGAVCPSLRQRAVHARVRYQFYNPQTRDEACERYIMPMMAVKVFGKSQPVARLVSPGGDELSVLLERLGDPQPVGKLFEVLRWYADGDEVWNGDQPLCLSCSSDDNSVADPTAVYDTSSNMRYEAIRPSSVLPSSVFSLEVGYVDRIDMYHGHIHVFDSFSRHFVADATLWQARVGQYVVFYPIVPQQNVFKSAVISEMLPLHVGVHRFGLRTIRLVAYNAATAMFGWQLIGGNNQGGEYIVEKGTQMPAYNSGGISFQMLVSFGIVAPCVGDVLRVNVFLKRATDGVKYPYFSYICR